MRHCSSCQIGLSNFEAAPPQNRIHPGGISVALLKCAPGVFSDGGRLVEWVDVPLGGVEAPAGVAERVPLILVDLGSVVVALQ